MPPLIEMEDLQGCSTPGSKKVPFEKRFHLTHISVNIMIFVGGFIPRDTGSKRPN